MIEMATRAGARRKFLQRYRNEFSNYEAKAKELERFVGEILQGSNLEIHKVEARPKHPESAHLKLLRKQYTRPEVQLTDKIGVRIITYYSEDVDRVVDLLKPRLEIDEKKSVDKRRELGLRAFGYSSVHLIARLKHRDAKKSLHGHLGRLWFEVQVRSILEHAWAEVEHEIVFKSGIKYPDAVVRRFAAIAGTLEVLGNLFGTLRRERTTMIDDCRKRYANGLDGAVGLDSVRLLGFLESTYPRNLSWREAEKNGRPFPPRIAATCVEALKSCRLSTAASLTAFFRSRFYRRAVKTFAAAELMKSVEVSHLALVVIAVALRSGSVFRDYFPLMAEGPGMAAVLEKHRGST